VCTKLGVDDVGYNYFDDVSTKENSYISSVQKSSSHDLRFISSVSHIPNLDKILMKTFIRRNLTINECNFHWRYGRL
jgi:hypothetical protein